MKQDVLHKTLLVFLALVLVAGGGYFWQQREAPVPAPITQKRERVVRTITLEDTARANRRYANDEYVMQSLRACQTRGLSIRQCVEQLRERFDVQAGLPDEPAADGFQGFIMFPLKRGNMIVGYNPTDRRDLPVFYGDFSDLQDLVEQGGLGDKLLNRINAIETSIP